MSGVSASSSGLSATNRPWLISRAPKLASEVRMIRARFRSAYRPFSLSVGGTGSLGPSSAGRPPAIGRSATMLIGNSNGLIHPDGELADAPLVPVRQLRDDVICAGLADVGGDRVVRLRRVAEVEDHEREI